MIHLSLSEPAPAGTRLSKMAATAKEPAIFLAAQVLPGNPGGTWSMNSNGDQVLLDNLLAYSKENVCIDTTRVFATGFSFGGMMTYSLSEHHQKQIRAAVGIAPAKVSVRQRSILVLAGLMPPSEGVTGYAGLPARGRPGPIVPRRYFFRTSGAHSVRGRSFPRAIDVPMVQLFG